MITYGCALGNEWALMMMNIGYSLFWAMMKLGDSGSILINVEYRKKESWYDEILDECASGNDENWVFLILCDDENTNKEGIAYLWMVASATSDTYINVGNACKYACELHGDGIYQQSEIWCQHNLATTLAQ